MTVDLSVEIDEPDRSTLSVAAGAAGRTLEAYVAELVHADAVRLRQAEALSRLADQRFTVQDTWFPPSAAGHEGAGSVEDQLDD